MCEGTFEINHTPMMYVTHTHILCVVVAAASQAHAQTPLRTDKCELGGEWLRGNMFFI